MPNLLRIDALPGAGVRAARIHSLQRCLYLVELLCEGGPRWLSADGRARAVFRSPGTAREALASLPGLRLTLCHESCYDEMIGLGGGGQTRLEVAIAPVDV